MSSSALPLPLLASCNQSHQRNHSLSSSNLSLPASSPTRIEQGCEDFNPQTSLNPPRTTRTIRYRLSQLCREAQPHIARQLFDTIPRPTTVVWNTIIIGFVCNNLPLEALLFYARMRSSFPDTKCDSYTYSATLKACAEARQLKVGKCVHCHILRSHLYPSNIVYNSLLNMYATCMSSTENESAALDCYFSRYDLVSKLFDTMRKRNAIAWNTLISWHVRTRRYGEAVKHFKMMMKMGVKPTVVSFVNVFPAVSRIGDNNNAYVLYGLLLKFGSEYIDDLFTVSSAICMFAELGSLDTARKVFDHCLVRNTEVWNSMIGAYVQNNCPVEALRLFQEALQSNCSVLLDDVTFLSALTAASQLQQLEFAQQLHACTIKNSFALCVVVLNAIIVMYSRCNSIEMSFEVFNTMQERDIVSWNTMVSAFVQNGLDVEGLMLVYEMQKQGFVVDYVTITALLSAASNLRNQEIGKQTHGYLHRHAIRFAGMESYLIDMYAKCGLMEAAQRLFGQISTHDKDQATWNAMISGNMQNRLIDQAFAVFRQMLEEKVTPTAVTLASLIPSCSLMGCLALGKQLHGFAIRKYLDKNIFVCTALVDMYSKSAAITYARSVFATSSEKNSVTYTNMILGYGQHGMGEKALSLFHLMWRTGIKPDTITFVAVLSACSYAGLVDDGLQIFESMEREYGIQPSLEHYCCVADMLGRAGRVMEAFDFIEKLGEEGIKLGIWGSLIAACKVHGQLVLGKTVANKLLEIERGSSMAGYYVLLSNIYAEEGKWEHVNKVRKGMREKGLMKEVGCSWIEIAGCVHCFMSRDQKHAQSDDIYEILGELKLKMKEAGYRPCCDSDIGWTSESEE